MKLYGTLDEKQIGRDRTADRSVNRLALAITCELLSRLGINSSQVLILTLLLRRSRHVCANGDSVCLTIRCTNSITLCIQLELPSQTCGLGNNARLLFRELR